MLKTLLAYEEEDGLFFRSMIQKYDYIRIVQLYIQYEKQIQNKQISEENLVVYKRIKLIIQMIRQKQIVNHTITIVRILKQSATMSDSNKKEILQQEIANYYRSITVFQDQYQPIYRKLIETVTTFEQQYRIKYENIELKILYLVLQRYIYQLKKYGLQYIQKD